MRGIFATDELSEATAGLGAGAVKTPAGSRGRATAVARHLMWWWGFVVKSLDCKCKPVRYTYSFGFCPHAEQFNIQNKHTQQ